MSVDKSSVFIFAALALSLVLNAFTAHRWVESDSIDRRQYSYVGDDHPRELPLRLDPVAITIHDSDKYTISGVYSWLNWQTLFEFPQGTTAVKLGLEGQEFELAMFNQLRCVEVLRVALINGPDGESGQCLNLLRQAVLCASDLTLDALNVKIDGELKGTNGVGMTHVCRDWTQLYAYVRENQLGRAWQVANTSTPVDGRSVR